MAKKILIVDDEHDYTDLTAYQLRRHDYAVLVAHDGEQALDMARRHRPDLILLDLMLPEINGFTVCEILRHHAPTQDIPILMVTALSGELTRCNGLASGANDFLTKPVAPAELLLRVEQGLRGKSKSPQVA
jgi:DNA-binding response OmpR family regulator